MILILLILILLLICSCSSSSYFVYKRYFSAAAVATTEEILQQAAETHTETTTTPTTSGGQLTPTPPPPPPVTVETAHASCGIPAGQKPRLDVTKPPINMVVALSIGQKLKYQGAPFSYIKISSINPVTYSVDVEIDLVRNCRNFDISADGTTLIIKSAYNGKDLSYTYNDSDTSIYIAMDGVNNKASK